MAKCSFCSREIKPGHGLMLVLNSGKQLYFCSSKCRKNWQLGRKPSKVKWVKKQKK